MDQIKQEIVWEPNPGPQTAFVSCPIFEVAYGGARGGGKTDGALGEWLNHSDQYGEHAIGLMVRRSLTELTETIERSKVLFIPLGGKYNSQEKMWRMPNKARLRFAYLENDSDADNYQGHSYTRVYVEEAGNFPSELPILKLMATLRSGQGVPCGIRLTFNPGGAGHMWVKRRYWQPNPDGWEVLVEKYKNPFTGEELERERIFIPAKVTDNDHLGPDYVANLQMLGNPALVRAWLEGDFNITAGAFYPEWNDNLHIVDDIPGGPPLWLFKYGAFDWGTTDPAACLWAFVSDGESFVDGLGNTRWFPRDAIVVYREMYFCDPANTSKGSGIRNEEMCDRIKEACVYDGEKNLVFLTDSLPHQDRGGPTIAQIFLSRGVTLKQGDTNRIVGWSLLRSRLIGKKVDANDDYTTPLIYFTKSCKFAREYIPALQVHPTKAQDAAEHGEPTHICDVARYLCASRPRTYDAPEGPAIKREAIKPNDISFKHALKQVQQIKLRVNGKGY